MDVSLELSSDCNMRCEYCYHSDQENLPFQKGFMTSGMAFKIIDQAAELKVNSLKFNWKGESTMNPDFELITSRAKSLAKGSTFIDRLTNSNFKFPNNKESIFNGLCNQTKVKVSFDSFDKDVLEQQRRGANYELILKNIDTFYNWPKRKETQIVIQAIKTTLNQYEDIYTLAKKRWPEATVSVRNVVEGRKESSILDLAHKHRDTSNRQSCIQAHVRVIFNWKGEASPCCPDITERLKIGDIKTQSLYEIFNSIAAKQLRKELKSHVAFEKDPCKTCSSYETYAGYVPSWTS